MKRNVYSTDMCKCRWCSGLLTPPIQRRYKLRRSVIAGALFYEVVITSTTSTAALHVLTDRLNNSKRSKLHYVGQARKESTIKGINYQLGQIEQNIETHIKSV